MTSIDFYNRNADKFAAETQAVDMSPVYAQFLPLIKPKGHILDAGCGAGRDTRHFLQCGYSVTAFDASPAMAEIASRFAGLSVGVLKFDEIKWRNTFDAVWACASLLHETYPSFIDSLRKLVAATVPEGVLFVSVKQGPGIRESDGRTFYDYTEERLREAVSEIAEASVIQTWVSKDLREDQARPNWLNVLIVHRGAK